jgi:RNase adaptor protein for sRNA GlmZ degradation
MLNLYIKSFAYKNGIPDSPDHHGEGFVFDCRCIPNPGKEERYKTLTGQTVEVKEYIENQPAAEVFWKNVFNIIELAVNTYKSRNFESLSINFGCTGGQHRSVYFAEKLAGYFRNEPHVLVHLVHRELSAKK